MDRGPAGSISWCWMRRISTTARAIPYLDITGKDWPDNALRFGALSYVAAEIGRGLIDSYAPDLIQGARLAGGAGAGLSALWTGGRATAADHHHHPQPRLPGPVSGEPVGDAAPAEPRLHHRRRGILRADRLLEGGPGARRPHHPPSRRPMRSRSRAARWGWASTACSAIARPRSAASSTASIRRPGIRRRIPACRRPTPRASSRRARRMRRQSARSSA